MVIKILSEGPVGPITLSKVVRVRFTLHAQQIIHKSRIPQE